MDFPASEIVRNSALVVEVLMVLCLDARQSTTLNPHIVYGVLSHGSISSSRALSLSSGSHCSIFLMILAVKVHFRIFQVASGIFAFPFHCPVSIRNRPWLWIYGNLALPLQYFWLSLYLRRNEAGGGPMITIISAGSCSSNCCLSSPHPLNKCWSSNKLQIWYPCQFPPNAPLYSKQQKNVSKTRHFKYPPLMSTSLPKQPWELYIDQAESIPHAPHRSALHQNQKV